MAPHNKLKDNKDHKVRNFRLAIIDDMSHKQLLTVHFTRVGFVVAIVSIVISFTLLVFALIAFTPIRTFVPGYPDERSKRAAIQNAIRIDSLENVIFKWELYSENLRRSVEGREPVKIDSIINANRAAAANPDAAALQSRDSMLRKQVRAEEQFEISSRDKRSLPIEGMHFFTPVKGVISQKYDPDFHPFIDITAPEGTVVKAVLDGTVISAGWNEETGNSIQIQHSGDIVSIYRHNEKLLKKTGDKVTAGTPIALLGNTGTQTTGAHLHFELWHNGETVDPTLYINF
ncbi:MAG: M23 family metallopeptidase [Candidatus Cryptobacteroides sp.]